MKYKVFQIPFPRTKHEEIVFCKYAYQPLNRIDNVNLDYYENIYEGNIETSKTKIIEILEELFVELNYNHPEDFHGHSLSVSDIVKLGNKYYFCDSYGWKEIEF